MLYRHTCRVTRDRTFQSLRCTNEAARSKEQSMLRTKRRRNKKRPPVREPVYIVKPPPVGHLAVATMNTALVLDELRVLGVHTLTLGILFGAPDIFRPPDLELADAETRAWLRAVLINARAIARTPYHSCINAQLLSVCANLEEAMLASQFRQARYMNAVYRP